MFVDKMLRWESVWKMKFILHHIDVLLISFQRCAAQNEPVQPQISEKYAFYESLFDTLTRLLVFSDT